MTHCNILRNINYIIKKKYIKPNLYNFNIKFNSIHLFDVQYYDNFITFFFYYWANKNK
jgi:hypothetical protein